MEKKDYEKNVIAIILAITIIAGSFWSGAYKYADEMIMAVLGEVETE